MRPNAHATPSARQAGLHVQIFRDVNRIIIVYEFVGRHRPKGGHGQRNQNESDQDFKPGLDRG